MSSLKQKKVKGVRQKLKLFRANDPLRSVLMWGVNYSYNQLQHVKPRAMLLADDFKAFLKVKVSNHLFNRDNMPSRFKFKEYCPLVFKNIRERFNIDAKDFWDSMTKRQPNWDSSHGRSGSKFLTTYNKHYFIKTISSEEVEEMHHILQSYHEYIVHCGGETRLPQYLAMYRLTVNDQETYILVMRSIFTPRMPVYKKYDLKGSTVDRIASEKDKKEALPTFKDVDFLNDNCKVCIGPDAKASLMQTLERDVQFLQTLHLMDYSLIVGIHDVHRANDLHDLVCTPTTEDEDTDEVLDASEIAPVADTPPESSPLNSPPNGLQIPTYNEKEEPHKGDDLYAVKGVSNERLDQSSMIYFMAITDILTRYGMRKRTAQTYKTVKHGAGAEISTVKPDVYGRRFLEFIGACIE